VDAHLAGADRVVHGIDPGAQDGADVVVGAHVRGEHVFLLQRLQRRRFHQPPRGLEALHHVFEIVRVAEKIRVDRGGRHRSGTAPSPIPDSMKSCGDWNAPDDTITSRRARHWLIWSPLRNSMPTARRPSNRMRDARASSSTRRLARVAMNGWM